MGNIIGKVDSKYMIRSYDLKGSTHSRKVLESFDNNEEVIKKTLKDLDFMNL
jgi:hypothetical protein